MRHLEKIQVTQGYARLRKKRLRHRATDYRRWRGGVAPQRVSQVTRLGVAKRDAKKGCPAAPMEMKIGARMNSAPPARDAATGSPPNAQRKGRRAANTWTTCPAMAPKRSQRLT